MIMLRRTRLLSIQRKAGSLARPSRHAHSSAQDKVQTPLQAQRKESIATSGRQPAEAVSSVQTPFQSQDPATFAAARPAQTLRDPGPLYTLVGGLLAGSAFVWWYYHQRKSHMEQKWANMLQEAAEKRGANS